MADKKKFPNPEFFRAKTEMDWKAQAANLKEFGSIALDLIKETDWKAFGRKQKEHFLDNMNRVAREAKTVAAMTCAERKDLLLNGEKHLGALYRKGDMATVRREWRGVESTLVDFSGWLKVWGMLLATFSKDLIPALNTTFWYRWMISYMCCVSFMDKNTMGQRGNALKMSHLMTYDIFRYVAENLVFLAKCDKKNGNSSELNKKVVLFDEMTMGQIMAGFPDLLGIPYQLMPVFLVSEIDQLTCVPYIDAVESFGLPADCCPVPSSECGALVIDALPHMGKCFISSSMPCDGSTMASSYMSRRFPDLPVFHLCFPVRYEDEETVQMGAEDIRACIKFIEEQTGAKWSWDAYFSAMKRFNEETRYELEKWEVNKTAYPQIIGPSYELFRKWNYEMDGGIDPRVMKTCRKVNDLLMQSYQRRDEAWGGQNALPRHRVELPRPLLRQLLQLAGQLLGHQHPGGDGIPELHQAPGDRGQGGGTARSGAAVRAYGHAPSHQRRLPERGGRAVAPVRGVEHQHHHHVPERGLQEHGHRTGHPGRAGPRARLSHDLDRA